MAESFVFYASFAEAASELSDEQYGVLMRAINEYALYDQEPDLSGVPRMLFVLIKPQLDANKKRRENGKYGALGGRPQKEEPNGKQKKESDIIEEKPIGLLDDTQNKNPIGFKNTELGCPKNNPNVNDNVNDNVNGIGANAPAPDGAPPTESKRFVKPTLAEVAEYCKERGNNVNPERWYAHYDSNGWKVGKNPMKDWRAAVRTWEHNNFAPPRNASPPIEQADANYNFDKVLEAMQDWG